MTLPEQRRDAIERLLEQASIEGWTYRRTAQAIVSVTEPAAPDIEPPCQHVFAGTQNLCGAGPIHPVHIYDAWDGPEEYHAFIPEWAAQAGPPALDVSLDDVRLGLRDGDWLQLSLRTTSRDLEAIGRALIEYARLSRTGEPSNAD